MEIEVSECHITFYPESKYEAYLLGRVDAICPAYERKETTGGESLASLTFVVDQLLRAAGGVKIVRHKENRKYKEVS